MTRIGGVVALLNTSLAGAALAHCINIVAPKHVIVAAELIGAVASARPRLAEDVRIWVHGACAPGDCGDAPTTFRASTARSSANRARR